jgi:poly-gamma-glutamate synthase PgsB/CapB
MGETLEEIAMSLSRTIPYDGIIITAEQQPALLSILYQEASKKCSRLLIADGSTVFAGELANFNHFAIEANVAIGFVLADLLGLSRGMALQAMQAAEPDPGAFLLQHIRQRSQTIVWANLFAVNDRESFVDLCERLFLQHPNHQRVIILNNRHDRPTRVRLFAELSIKLGFELTVTFGDYEAEVNEALSSQQIKLLNLGNTTKQCNANGEQLLSEILLAAGGQRPVLLIGTVNIHTVQAERLLEHINLLQLSTSVVD